MKSINYFLILLVFILGQTGCSWVESPSSREDRANLLAQIEMTQKSIQKKQKMLEPIHGVMPVANFDCSKKRIKELKAIYHVLQQIETALNNSILVWSSRVSAEEREEAYQQNARIEFSVSPDMAVENLVAIVQMIEDYQIVYPRILSVQITGTNTVEVMTGGPRGLRDGIGDLVRMERKNGEWIINNVGHWTK